MGLGQTDGTPVRTLKKKFGILNAGNTSTLCVWDVRNLTLLLACTILIDDQNKKTAAQTSKCTYELDYSPLLKKVMIATNKKDTKLWTNRSHFKPTIKSNQLSLSRSMTKILVKSKYGKKQKNVSGKQ